jgi:ABC-2 type transport system permease protein
MSSTSTTRGVHDLLRAAPPPPSAAADGSAAGWSAARTLPLRVELGRQWRRRRTQLVLAGLALFPLILAALFARNRGGVVGGTRFVDLATGGAVNFALFVVFVSSTLLIVVVVALFCGDTVASEAQWSSLKYLLASPVGRARLLRQKLVVSFGLALSGLVILPVSALISGGIFFGFGPARTPLGSVIPTGEALFRLAIVIGYLAVSMLFVASLAFFLGVHTDAPLGAVGGAVMLVIVSTILDQVEDLGPVRQILPTHYLGAWVDAFNDPVVWSDMARGVILSTAYAAVLLALAWRKFLRKDVLS